PVRLARFSKTSWRPHNTLSSSAGTRHVSSLPANAPRARGCAPALGICACITMAPTMTQWAIRGGRASIIAAADRDDSVSVSDLSLVAMEGLLASGSAANRDLHDAIECFHKVARFDRQDKALDAVQARDVVRLAIGMRGGEHEHSEAPESRDRGNLR